MIAPGYFSLMKIPVLDGRDFDLHDDAQSRKVAIVNQEFARRFFAGRNPIGHKIKGWGEWFTIVGVVQGIKYRQFTEDPRLFFYIPIRQIFRPEYGMTLHVRTSGPVAAAITAIRREVSALDPALTVFDTESMTEFLSASLFGQKIAASLLSVLGGMALLLAAIGLYSVMAYSVAQRTSEIGIRVTLGAQPRDVMALVIRQGVGFALAGLVAGSLVAAALARVLASALVAVSPADPIVYFIAGIFTVVIALLSAVIPAWRALRVDPMVALRYQ
jgi:predicted permease